MNIRRILALLMAVMLLFVAGCGEGATVSDDGYSEVPLTEKFKGQTLKFLYCTPYPWLSVGSEHIYAFEDEYGVTVESDLSMEGSLFTKLAALALSDQSPDICTMYKNFPSVLDSLQPIENSSIDINDKFWNQSLLKASTIDGKPYIIDSVENIDAYFGICVYDSSLFEEHNITPPKEYYDKGEWTYDSFVKCIEQVDALGDDYIGAIVHQNSAMLLSGDSFFEFDSASGKFNVSATEDIRRSMNFLSGLSGRGLIVKLRNAGNRNIGLMMTSAAGIKFFDAYTSSDPKNIRAVLLPKKDTKSEHIVASPISGFGLVKGARNPELAGLFLQETLKKESRDLSYIFSNEEVQDFYYDVYEQYSDKIKYYIDDDLVMASNLSFDFYHKWDEVSADETDEYIDGELKNMQRICDKVDEKLKDIQTKRKVDALYSAD